MFNPINIFSKLSEVEKENERLKQENSFLKGQIVSLEFERNFYKNLVSSYIKKIDTLNAIVENSYENTKNIVYSVSSVIIDQGSDQIKTLAKVIRFYSDYNQVLKFLIFSSAPKERRGEIISFIMDLERMAWNESMNHQRRQNCLVNERTICNK